MQFLNVEFLVKLINNKSFIVLLSNFSMEFKNILQSWFLQDLKSLTAVFMAKFAHCFDNRWSQEQISGIVSFLVLKSQMLVKT